MGIAERVPRLQEELERLEGKNGGADEGNQHDQGRFSTYV